MSTAIFLAALLAELVVIVLMANMSFAHRVGFRTTNRIRFPCKSDLTVSSESDLGFGIGFDFFSEPKPKSDFASQVRLGLSISPIWTFSKSDLAFF